MDAGRQEKIEDAAAEWLVRMDRHPDDAAIREQLEHWLDEDIRHYAAFMRARMVWDRAERLSHLRPVSGEIDAEILLEKPRFPFRSLAGSWRWLFAGPAVAACLVLMGIVIWNRMGWTEYETGIGDIATVTLKDGSKLTLNTATGVRVKLTSIRRLVELTHGEAHFAVANQPERPFDVISGTFVIRAVGTAFSVRNLGAEEAQVLMQEGTVVVNPSSWQTTRSGTEQQTSLYPTLHAGAVALVNKAGAVVEQKSYFDIEQRLAWRNGRLWFEERPLIEVVSEFNRYNEHQMVVSDSSLAGLRIGGSFSATDVHAFIEALHAFGVDAIDANESAGRAVSMLVRSKEASVTPSLE